MKHEYIGGTVHAMAGATIRHNNIATNALGMLYGQLRGKPCQPFNSDTKVRIELPEIEVELGLAKLYERVGFGG